MLRSCVWKIQKGVSLMVSRKPTVINYNGNQVEIRNNDVSKGYFAVIAIKDGEIKRFVVELDYLTNPEFLELLDQAGEEYGFNQQGTLAIPCKPQQLQNILNSWRITPHTTNDVGRDIYFPKFL